VTFRKNEVGAQDTGDLGDIGIVSPDTCAGLTGTVRGSRGAFFCAPKLGICDLLARVFSESRAKRAFFPVLTGGAGPVTTPAARDPASGQSSSRFRTDSVDVTMGGNKEITLAPVHTPDEP
jgi:hypothetical protein